MYCAFWVLGDFDASDAGVSADEDAGFVDGWGYKAICWLNIQRSYLLPAVYIESMHDAI